MLDLIEIILWFGSIILLVLIGYVFLKDAKNKVLTKNFILIGTFFYWFIGARICRLIAKFIIGYPYGFFEFDDVLLLLAILYTIFSYTGLFMIFLFLERTILKKTHYFFSIMVILTTVLSIVNYQIPIIAFLAPLYVIVLLGMPLIFLNLARKSSGSVRRNALIVAIGIVFFVLGVAFDIPEAASIWATIPGMQDITKFASPILQIIGVIMMWKGFPREV
jgi:hypothetical protein